MGNCWQMIRQLLPCFASKTRKRDTTSAAQLAGGGGNRTGRPTMARGGRGGATEGGRSIARGATGGVDGTGDADGSGDTAGPVGGKKPEVGGAGGFIGSCSRAAAGTPPTTGGATAGASAGGWASDSTCPSSDDRWLCSIAVQAGPCGGEGAVTDIAAPTGKGADGSDVRPVAGGAAGSAAACASRTAKVASVGAAVDGRDDIALATVVEATTARKARVAKDGDTSAAAATTGATALATAGGTKAISDGGMLAARARVPAGDSGSASLALIRPLAPACRRDRTRPRVAFGGQRLGADGIVTSTVASAVAGGGGARRPPPKTLTNGRTVAPTSSVAERPTGLWSAPLFPSPTSGCTATLSSASSLAAMPAPPPAPSL